MANNPVDVAEEKAYVHLTGALKRIQISFGADLKQHPVRPDLVEADSLVDVPEEVYAHGHPPMQHIPFPSREKYEKAVETAMENSPVDFEAEKNAQPEGDSAEPVKTADGLADPHGRPDDEKESAKVAAKREKAGLPPKNTPRAQTLEDNQKLVNAANKQDKEVTGNKTSK